MIRLLEEKRPQIAELCRKYAVERLDVFGSAAAEDEYDDARSDVDFLVRYPPGHHLGPWLKDYFTLRDDLAMLLGRPVDLVMATAPRNRYFIREMERTRRSLYAA
jgi:uncharacterized protein